jgi:Fic family protein
VTDETPPIPDSLPSITPADIRAADALYEPFAPFEDWASLLVDQEVWDHYVARLTERRSAVPPEAYDRAVDHTMRLAAVDTGAIEGLYSTDRGFTVSVAEQAAAWEIEMDKRGSHVRPLFEAQRAAYDMVLDAATQSEPVSDVFIRTLHQTVTRGQEKYRVLTDHGWDDRPLNKGEYKDQPNHPWSAEGVLHAYASVLDTPPEMYRLILELRSESFLTAHPVLEAAYSHYSLVCIHPFADGNGRVARALASVYLFRAASNPFLVFADQTNQYLDALSAADQSRPQVWVDFVFDRALAAIARFTEVLRVGMGPPARDSLAALAALAVALPGMTHQQLDETAQRLFAAFRSEIQRQLAELEKPGTMQEGLIELGVRTEQAAGYRAPINPSFGGVRLHLTNAAPAEATVDRDFDISIAKGPRKRATLVINARHNGDSLELGIDDAYPELTSDAVFRVATFVSGQLNEALHELSTMAAANREARGY